MLLFAGSNAGTMARFLGKIRAIAPLDIAT
jgi:hypothetical protein